MDFRQTDSHQIQKITSQHECDKADIRNSSSTDQKQKELDKLEKSLNQGLKDHELESGDQLENEIKEKINEVQLLEKSNKMNKAQQRKKSLKNLQDLYQIYQQLIQFQQDDDGDDEKSKNSGKTDVNNSSLANQKQKEFDNLQKSLNQGLKHHELESGDQLEKLENEIKEKINEVQLLEKSNKMNKAQQRKKSLEDLQNLYQIYSQLIQFQQDDDKISKNSDKTGVTNSSLANQKQKELDQLQKSLNQGLKNHELESGDQLENKIKEKINEVQLLEKSNKMNKASERKKSLENLQNLYQIYQQINRIQQENANENNGKSKENDKTDVTNSSLADQKQKELDKLEKSLNQGLKDHELQSGDQLENEIKEKINEVQLLEKSNKMNKAQQRKKSLEDLQNLYQIYQQLIQFQHDDDDEKNKNSNKTGVTSSSLADQKQKGLDELQKSLNQGLKDLELETGDQLENEIKEKINDIQLLEKSNKMKKASERKKSLENLQNLYQIYQQINHIYQDDGEESRKISNLQKQLENGLKDIDLESGDQLESEITLKRDQIQKLEKQNRATLALQRKKSLEKLENLYKIFEELQNFKDDDEQRKLNELKQQLKQGLNDIELESGDLLEGEIITKKEIIQTLKQQKRDKQVLQRQQSLEKLENLYKIYQQINNSSQNESKDKNFGLQSQLENGLKEVDLENGDQLESEIKRKKEEIQTLLVQKKNNQALLRQKSLKKLENLYEIYQKLEVDKDNQEKTKLNELKQQLEQGLKDIELESGDLLENEINFIKQDILDFEKNKRAKLVKERKEFLEQVQKLQNIYQQIQNYQNQSQEEEQKIEFKQSEQVETTYSQRGLYKSDQNQEIPNQQDSLKQLLEEQISLQEDILQYPECVEKQILILINQIIDLQGNTPSGNEDTKTNLVQLSQQIEIIQRLLLVEDLMTENSKSIISSIKYSINNLNLQEIYSYAQQLLKFLRPLNIFELKRLIKKTEDSAKQIENKDILLLLGGTGAGKSTTIHFLAGSEMKMQQVSLPGGDILQYIGPVVERIKDINLKKIIVSPFAVSETRFLTAVNVNTKNLGMLKEQSLIICDTPGFGDTAGAEVDIANGIGIVQAIQGCKSVRPIILASNQSIGDRGEGIRTLARTLVGLINKVEEHLRSFSYLYTKFNDKSIEGISALLKSIFTAIQKDPNENHDQQFVSLFENMAENPGQKVDALRGKPSDCIRYILQQKPIKNPNEVFIVSITDKSKEVIRDQLNLHKSSIISATKRNDFLLIKHKLDDMLYLIQTLNQKQLKNIYEESISYIKSNLNQNYQKITEQFNRNLKKNNSLSIEDIKEYKKCIYEFKEIDQLRVSHMGNDLFSSESLIQNLKSFIYEINTGLNENTIKEYNQQKNKFDNQKLLASEFPELQEQYDNLQYKIQQIQQQIISKAERALKSKNYKEFSENLSYINQQITQYADHCNNDQLQMQYNSLIQQLISQLIQITTQADPILKNEFNQESSDKIKEIIQQLLEVKETYELREHITVDKIQNIINDLNEKIFKKFEKLCKEINEILNSESEKSFKDIEGLVNQMKLIKDSQNHSEKIQELFHQTTQRVFGKMQEVRRDAEMILSTFHHSPQSVNYQKVYRCVKQLVDAQWMDGIREDSFNEIMKNINDDLIKHALIIFEQLQDTDLDLINYKNLEKSWDYVSQIQAMSPFEEKIIQLQKYRENAEQRFQKSTSDVFEFINKTFNLDSQAVRSHKQQLKKLKGIQEEYNNPLSLVKYLKENKIEDYNEFCQKIQKLEDEICLIEKNIPQMNVDMDQPSYKQNDQNLEEVEQEVQHLNERALLKDQQRQLISKQEALQREKSVKEKYQILLNSEELKAEKEDLLEKNEFKNIKSLIDRINDLEQKIEETEKIEQDYIFGKLDGQLVEDALNYLEQCKKIRMLREDASKLQQHHVNKFLKKYVENISQDLNSNFVKIKSISSGETSAAFQYSQQLASSLQEIIDIQPYPKVYEIIKGRELLNQWRKNIQQNFIELREQMHQCTINGQSVRIHLDIAKALTQLDFLINEENNYYQLFKQYQSKLTEGIRDIYKTILNLIDKCEFQQVAGELLDIDDNMNNKAMEQIRHNVNITITEILENTKRKSISLILNSDLTKQMENMNIIVENLRKVNNAKKYVPQFFNEVTPKNNSDQEKKEDVEEQTEKIQLSSTKQPRFQIDKDLELIKKIIQEKISKYIDSIEALIEANDFEEAENKRENVLQICQILGDLCVDVKLTRKVDQLQKSIEEIIDKSADEYILMPQDKYLITPPKQILEKLKKVANRSIKYTQSYNKIKENIHTKIREQIKGLKDAWSHERDEQIQQIEQTLHFLPDDMKLYLEGELKQQKEAVKKTEDIYEKELEEIKVCQDINQLQKFRERCEKNKMDNFKRKVDKKIFDQCQKCKLEIKENLVQGDIKKIIDSSKILNNLLESFKDIVGIEGISDEVKKEITQKILKSIDFIKQNSKSDMIEEIKSNFEIVATFCSLKLDSNMTKDIDLKKEINELFSELSKYFQSIQEQQEDSLQNLSMSKLAEALELLEKRNELFKEIVKNEALFKEKGTENFKNENFKQILKCRTYEQSIDYSQQKLKNVFEDVQGFKFKKDNVSQIIKYYKSFNAKLQALEDAKKVKKHFQKENLDLEKYDQDCNENIKKKVEEVMEQVNKIIEKNENLAKEELEDLNFKYQNMIHLNEVKIHKVQVQEVVQQSSDKMKTYIDDKVKSYSKQINLNSGAQQFADSIVQMKRIADYIYSVKNEVDKKISDVLQILKQKNDGGVTVGIIATILEKEPKGIGKILLSEHTIFKGQSIAIFNLKTQKHGVKYVIDKIKGNDLSQERLETLHNKIKQRFQELMKYCLLQLESKKISQENILNNLVSQIKEFKQEAKNGDLIWDANVKKGIPKLISLIFSLWSFQNIEYYNENVSSKSQDSQNEFMLQPHPGQIISILRMLGLGYDSIKENKKFVERVKGVFVKNEIINDDKLRNNLIEIGTGEGKSVTLAVTTSILAILGADVSCACYSQYLSQRDYDSFLPIFEKLDLIQHINYGPFTKICEEIINEEGDVRNRVIKLIENQPIIKTEASNKNKRPKILLIDEVDVFFSTQFYGNVYTPLARLKHETIEELITFLWKEKNNKLTYQKAKQSQAFQNCCKKFEGWQKLLDEALKDLIADLQNYEHEYEVTTDGRIGYKEQDGISFNISYGYKTLFAHYEEYEKGKITQTTLKENTFIGIRCGSFSYAEIPHKFKYIMGVTGTLQNLTKYETKIVEEIYQIQHKTFIPSVFGENKRKFATKEDIYVENLDNYNKTLIDQINKKLDKRAILVFFENKEKLQSFYESSEIEPLKNNVKLITEQVSSSLQEKNMLIKQSTTCGSISLISKVFGRGTDFICRDQTVVNNGGTHVISTFFSDEASEEIQILGRTARQGQDGSVSLVLLENDLEKFLGSNYNQQITNMREKNNFYDKLTESRQKIADMRYKDTDICVTKAKKEHENAEKLVKCLNSGTEGKDELLELLILQNKGATLLSSSNSRTICLMDATGSMGGLLSKVKDTVQQMFFRASAVLNENKIEDDCFQMQFAVYRDYDNKIEGILNSSTWESKPDNLREFIKNVKAQGGGDYEEAIEIGLWHANQEHKLNKISQVILIGDAPAKDKKAIEKDRNYYGGDKYWLESKFSKMTHYKKELKKLKEQGIPVHSFYLDEGTQENFQEISTFTGGKCSKLDINSDNGSEQLTGIITESILNNIGGEKLVQSYKKLFCGKSYS